MAIRPFSDRDSSALVEIFENADVARYVDDGKSLTREQAELWLVRSRENLDRFGYGTGAVVELSSDRLIGWAGFARPSDGPEQIIYGLAKERWHQGLGREIVEALVEFGDRLGLDSLSATVHPANIRPVRLLEANGFSLSMRAYGGETDADLYQRMAPH